jgi:hypothetical protein
MVADFVFEYSDEPAALRALPGEMLKGLDGGEQGVLDEVAGEFGMANADERESVKAVAVFIDPSIGIDRGPSRCLGNECWLP